VPLAGSTASLGVTNVTLTVTDAAGNFTTCANTFTVLDTTPPSINACAPAQSAPADSSCQAILPDFTSSVIATDACGSVVVTQSPSAGTGAFLGSTVVTLTVTDLSGNSAQCSSSFTVTDVDTDGDGTVDCQDGCPNDPFSTTPGPCGCGVAVTDNNGNSTPDCNEAIVRISQVYGSGGNSLSPLRFRTTWRSTTPVATAQNLAGWSIQYASSSTGTSWTVTTLPGGDPRTPASTC
jgi:hypothetical protein